MKKYFGINLIEQQNLINDKKIIKRIKDYQEVYLIKIIWEKKDGIQSVKTLIEETIKVENFFSNAYKFGLDKEDLFKIQENLTKKRLFLEKYLKSKEFQKNIENLIKEGFFEKSFLS